MDHVSVTIQVEGAKARWVSVCRARLLYADRNTILVRQMGATSLYHGNGAMHMAGYNPKHPDAKKLPQGYAQFRVHPKSVENLRRALVPDARKPASERMHIVGK